MARASEPIDIDDVPALVRLARQVRDSGQPRVLRDGGREVAVLTPLPSATGRRPRRTKRAADYAAFRSTAGGWKDLVDADKLIADIYADREISHRPPVDL